MSKFLDMKLAKFKWCTVYTPKKYLKETNHGPLKKVATILQQPILLNT